MSSRSCVGCCIIAISWATDLKYINRTLPKGVRQKGKNFPVGFVIDLYEHWSARFLEK